MTTVIQYWDGEKWQHENPVQAQGKIEAPASVAEAASLNIPVGVAPTSPTIGDVWQTTDGLYYRNNAGASVGPLGAPPTLDPDLVAIAALTGTSGLLRKTAADTWSLDTNTYITGNQSISLSGDISGSGTTAITTTLATVNSNVGSFGSATQVATFTVNAKGLITAASNTSIQIAQGQVTNLTTDLAAKAALASPTFTGTPAAPTAARSTSSTQIATTAFVKGMFGGISVAGVADWNDATNARAGLGETLLMGTATNGPGPDAYFYALNFEYSSTNGTGNITQLAIPYATPTTDIWMRGRYSDVWGSWVKILTTANTDYSAADVLAKIKTVDGSGSGLDADLLDGQHGSYYVTLSETETITGAKTFSGPLTASRYTQATDGVPTSNLGQPSVAEMALFDGQFTNKLWFYDPTKFTFTYTMNGTDWITQSNSTSNIKKLVAGAGAEAGSLIVIPNLAQKYRIDIRNAGTYVYLNALYLYFSTNSHQMKVHIWKKRDDGSWIQHTNSDAEIANWPGHAYLPFSTIPWSTELTGGHYNDIRIEIIPRWTTGGSWDNTDINLWHLEVWGGYPAGKRTIYSWDENANVSFSQNVGIGISGATGYRLDTSVSNPTNGVIARFTNTGTAGQTGAQLMFEQYNVGYWSIGQPAGVDAFTVWRGRSAGTTGTEALRIDSNNNLFMGTTGGSGRINIRAISDSAATVAELLVQNTAGTDAHGLYVLADPTNNETILASSGSQPGSWKFRTGNTDVLKIANGGQLSAVYNGSIDVKFAKASVFGYGSGTYKALVLGDTGTTDRVTISLGYDPSSNSDGSGWNGDGSEVLFRNATRFLMPNAANNGFLVPLTFDSAGAVTLSNSLTIDKDSDSWLNISADPGTYRGVMFRTSLVPRWGVFVDTGSESGSNVGSGLAIARYDDSGAWIDAPMDIRRNDGRVHFQNKVVFGTNTLRNERVVIGNDGLNQDPLRLVTYSNDGNAGPILYFAHSRGSSDGVNVISQNGDRLGGIYFQGNSGNGDATAASIVGYVNGTPGASNDMPGMLKFSTSPDGSATPVERMRIDAAGNVVVKGGTLLLERQDTGYEGGQMTLTRASDNGDGWTVDAYGNTTTPNLRFINGAGQVKFTLQGGGTGAFENDLYVNEGVSVSTTSTYTFRGEKYSADAYGADLYLRKSRSATRYGAGLVQSGDWLGSIQFQGHDGTNFIQAGTITMQVDGTAGTNDMPGRMSFWTTADGASSATERMRIDSSGNVVIGTTTAKAPLHVATAASVTEAIRVSNALDGAVVGEAGIGFDPNAHSRTYPAAKISAIEYDASDYKAHLAFYTRGADSDSAPTERMFIDSSGNVYMRNETWVGNSGGSQIRMLSSSGTSYIQASNAAANAAGTLHLGGWYGNGLVQIDPTGAVFVGDTAKGSNQIQPIHPFLLAGV